MVERENHTVRIISWAEVFPWLNILQVFRVAISARVLVLGAIGLLLTMCGWAAIGTIFGIDQPATSWLEPVVQCPWKAATDAVPDQPTLPYWDAAITPVSNADPISEPDNPVSGPWFMLSLPALHGIGYTAFGIRAAVCLFLCGVLGVAVWAFFGAAICRIAAVQLAAQEQVGLGAALRYAARKWPSYFAAPLFPIGGVLLAAIPVLVLGWIMRADVGLLVGGLVWPLALGAGLLMTLLLLGVLFGWPLMWATISTEGTDSFDALSRTYAYVFQRPLHYLFYAVVAGFIGWLGWLLVQNFAAGVVWMSYWAAGWGSGQEQLNALMNVGDLSGAAWLGAILVRFWSECVKLLAAGYLFSYFWGAAAAIYLLLRRDVDATEMDEVHLDADASEQTFDLPKVDTDAAGSPVVKESADAANPESLQ